MSQRIGREKIKLSYVVNERWRVRRQREEVDCSNLSFTKSSPFPEFPRGKIPDKEVELVSKQNSDGDWLLTDRNLIVFNCCSTSTKQRLLSIDPIIPFSTYYVQTTVCLVCMSPPYSPSDKTDKPRSEIRLMRATFKCNNKILARRKSWFLKLWKFLY